MGKFDELGIRFAVYMSLPIDGAQRYEVIAVCGFAPRQMHAGVAFAQEAAAVINMNLRQDLEYIFETNGNLNMGGKT